MNFVSAFFERRRQAKAERERKDREAHERWVAEYDRRQKEEAAWWESLTPEQKQAHLRQEQLDRIEKRLNEIRRAQQEDPNDYDII